MRTPLLVLCLGLAQAAASFESVSLNGTWGFSREGGAESPVEVPHDWAIAGPFDPDAEGRTGKLPWKGWGTYRRSFTVRKHLDGERVYLEFDGVMCDAAVTLNGVSVPGAVYGYLGFERDVTDLIRAGENDLVVQASTLRLRSRWYPGGGLYRDVRIVYRGKGHAIPGSVQIETECVTAAQADVIVRYRTREGDEERRFAISNPRRWDVDDPFLYTYEIAGERFRYGIRTCSFTKDDGFHLNGRRLQLQGVNLHADFGLLGVAWNRDAARRQLLILRDMGINAIRTSHNPTWPGMLDLCDEMGFIVWNECFDKWCETAGRDLATPLEDHVEDCLRRFVRRDRNHPSVVV